MVSHDLHIVMADSKEVLCINQHIRCAGTPESLSNDPTFIRLWGNQISQNVGFIRTIIIIIIICTVMFVVAVPIHLNANNKEKSCLRFYFPPCFTGLLLSLITAPLGAFVVWRKMAYFGDTLSHSALLGVALGIFLQINPYVAIVILTIILAVLMVWLESNTQFSVDTLLGIIAHSCLSLGVVTVGLLKMSA